MLAVVRLAETFEVLALNFCPR